MIEPERERQLDTLMSIFDLKIHRVLRLDKGVSARVLYYYDKDRNIRRFKVLSRDMSAEVHARITSWLEENLPDHAVISDLASNEMDADSLPAPFPPDPRKAV